MMRSGSWLTGALLSLAVVATILISAATARASDVNTVPPLQPPSGAVIRVSSESELQAAVRTMTSGTTLMIAPGTYRLTRSLVVGNRSLTNVTIRGASDRRDDVVIVGSGMTNPNDAAPFGIWVGNGVDGILIANLTVRDFYFHPVILNAGTRAPHLYNVRLVDGGQQLLKANPTSPGNGIPDGLVEFSVFEYTTTERDDYPKAIDVHGGANWIIRNNLFRNIRAPQGMLSGPAILIWTGSRNVTIEGNTFVNCQREIVVGGAEATPNGHEGGVIRNNFIFRDGSVPGDSGISVWDSPGTRVLHNTVLLSGTYRVAIEYRFPDTIGVVVANNLTDAPIIAREGATATELGNVTSASREMFTNRFAGDLHLAAAAAGAIDRGASVAGAPADWDGQPRPHGAASDVGADEVWPAQ